jgi:predicted TIM-barrel fold metal-dependent hydrolase
MYSGKRIDAHTHCIFDCDWDRIFAFMDERHLAKMNCICGGTRYSEMRIAIFKRMYELYPDRFSWGTYLPLPDFSVPAADYASGVIERLKRDFDDGATSCKAFRDIGMLARRPDGSFIMIDDPLFDPVFDYIASVDQVLIMHMAEPWSRWPSWPDDDLGSPERRTYRPLTDDAQWNPLECPGFWAQVEAEENVARKHPDLRIVCAHMAALSHDVLKVAEMLDRCPNLAIDTSARRRDLAVQNTETVRRFFTQYQDRILWGMDQQNYTAMSQMSPAERDDFYAMMNDGYAYEFALFESDGVVQVDEFHVQGLALPDDILEKFYYKNAEAWFGI